MRKLKCVVGLIGGLLVSGCATHLPPLETAPGSGGPSVSDIVDHLNCELATIVDGSDPRVVKRLGDAKESQLKALLPYLVKYHFVASVQLTLEVTDAEGLSPQLSFIHPLSAAMTNQTTLGGLSLNGSQDRSVTINYSVDLANLSKLGAKVPCVVSPALLQSVGLSGGGERRPRPG